jgi:transposase
MIEALRVPKACRRTAVTARRTALQMIHHTIVIAPEELRDALRRMTRMRLIRTLAAWRPDLTDYRNTLSAYRIALKSLARRDLELDDRIAVIVDELAPELVAREGIGHGSTAQLLLTAGDNPERLGSEASFAALCGLSPSPASSRKTSRHRLYRGGHRQANAALHRVAVPRMRSHLPTIDYVRRRAAEGKSTREIRRCLKRYIAREIVRHLRPRGLTDGEPRAVLESAPAGGAENRVARAGQPTITSIPG